MVDIIKLASQANLNATEYDGKVILIDGDKENLDEMTETLESEGFYDETELYNEMFEYDESTIITETAGIIVLIPSKSIIKLYDETYDTLTGTLCIKKRKSGNNGNDEIEFEKIPEISPEEEAYLEEQGRQYEIEYYGQMALINDHYDKQIEEMMY